MIEKTIEQEMGQLITRSSLLSSHPLFVDITVDLLKRGHRVCFQTIGRSMRPTINEGEIITVEPVKPSLVKRGDIVLYQNPRGVIAHRVVGIKKRSDELRGPPHHSSLIAFFILRGDALGACDEPVKPQQIFGRVVTVERYGRPFPLNSLKARMFHTARRHASLLKHWIIRIF